MSVSVLEVTSLHATPVVPLNGSVTLSTVSGDTIYYGQDQTVSSQNNTGTLTAGGSSVTLTVQGWVTSAGVSAMRMVSGSVLQDVVLGNDGLVGGPGGTGLTSSVAIVSSPTTFSKTLAVVTADSVPLAAGHGGGYGAPAAAPTLAATGSGVLTGAYQYVYTESDYFGESTPSPASAVVNPASQLVHITLPTARRGTSTRNLYRTKADTPGTYYFVSSMQTGGSGYHQTLFSDNTADSALGAQHPPSVDHTNQQQLILTGNNVSYIRNFPSDPGAADLTILTSDSAGVGLAVDCYGPILSRGSHSSSFTAERTGTAIDGGHAYLATFLDSAAFQDVQTAPVPVTVFGVSNAGAVTITPAKDVACLVLTPPSGGTTSPLQVFNTSGVLAFFVGNNGSTTAVGTVNIQGGLAFTDNKHISFGTTTGTRLGTATNQKFAFYNATPIVQPTGTPAAATDLASVISLANSLRTNLLALGLVA